MSGSATVGCVGRTVVDKVARLRAFNARLAAGRHPKPGQPHTALEALWVIEADKGLDALTLRLREIAQRIHDAEVADAAAHPN